MGLRDSIVARFELLLEDIEEQSAAVVPYGVVLGIPLEEGRDLLEGGVCEIASFDLGRGVSLSSVEICCGRRAQTHLFGHLFLERSVLLDLLALLFSCSLALVDHTGDAGNAVLGNCQPHFPNTRVQLPASLTLAMRVR